MSRWIACFSLLGLLVGLSAAQTTEPDVIANDPAYQAAADYSARMNHDAFLVYRDGLLVYETYAPGYAADEPHVLHSGTKSFSCAIATRAQMDGLLRLDEPVADTLDEWASDPVKSTITVRHLLSLSSGLPGYVDGPLRDRRGDAVALYLGTALQASPAESFSYGSSHFFVFAELMQRKLGGENAWDYLTRTIFTPLGIQVSPETDGAGQVDLAAGSRTTARQWARYGQLILQGGVWNGETLLDEALLRECFVASTANTLYGLTWWLMYDLNAPQDVQVDEPIPLSSTTGITLGQTTPQIIVAGGAFDQRLILIPSENLLVVRFARGSRRYSDAELIRLLLGG